MRGHFTYSILLFQFYNEILIFRPISNLLKMKPINDVAYSFQHGASVRKQWKDLVLSGNIYFSIYFCSLLTSFLLQVLTNLFHIPESKNASGKTAMRFMLTQLML